MNTTTTKKTWTEQELMSLPKEGYKYELIQGELVMGPAGIEHEEIGANLLTALRKFVSEQKTIFWMEKKF